MKLKRIFFTLFLLLFSMLLFAQESTEKKALTVEDYAKWRSIRTAQISGDGNWAAYGYSIREKDDTLYVKNINTDTTYQIPRGTNPSFSDDSQWVVYAINKPIKDIKKLQKDKKPIPKKAELLNLATGKKCLFENIASYTFSKGAGFVAVKKAKSDPKAKYKGIDLILVNLKTEQQELIGSVSEFRFNKPGTMLAYLNDVPDTNGNGIHLIDLQTYSRTPLDSDKKIYSQLAWDEDGRVLAVLKGDKKKKKKHLENVLLAFTDLNLDKPIKHVFNPTKIFDFPANTVISEKGNLIWSKDFTKVFFGLKEQEIDEQKGKDAPPVANVDVWHWKDERIQSVQQKQATRDQNFTYRSVYNLQTKRFLKLTDEKMRNLQITRDGNWGIGTDNKEYISDWKPRIADYYRVNSLTGKRTLMFKAQQRTLGFSPDSKHFLYWKEGHIWDYQILSGTKKNLTENVPISFINEEYDRYGEKPPHGVTGWTKDGKSVILRAKYDLLKISLTGEKAINLTNGVGQENEIRFRYIKLDPEEKFIDLSKPILLSAYGQWTKKAGFYQFKKGKLTKLILEDKRYGRLTKAKKAEKYFFTQETFADFPNYYISGPNFSSLKQITDANPWQKEYKWGRRILFEYKNKNGVRLQGTLAIPDDYQQGQKLPMMVNFYEKNSQNLHRYYTPGYASRVQFSGFVSNGYLVMQPDIHFNLRTSHSDMLECVEAAVQKVIDMGYADPKKVGLHGHSYSGGGGSYIATRSKMFAAIAAGAAPINLVSEFNQLFKGSGMNNHSYDIYGQGRYVSNPYDDFDLYWDQSPIAHVRTMNTPLLYLHGVDDPTVEYLQGMEFYNALRFNGKNIIFLSYPGEKHGLRKFENQKDFTIRIHQFFDHHLKEKPAPEWMEKGIPFLKKKK